MKPFTRVSGERSSWATVEISSALAALGPAACLGAAHGDDDRVTGPAAARPDVARGDEDLAAAGQISSRSGCPVAVASPPYGSVQAHHDRPSLSCSGRRRGCRCRELLGALPEHLTACRLT